MKKVLMTLCGVAMFSIAALAQQTDTTRIQNNGQQRTETGAQDQSSDRATQGQSQTQDETTAPALTTDSTGVDQPVDNGQNGTATPQDQSTQSGQTTETGTERKKKAKKNTP